MDPICIVDVNISDETPPHFVCTAFETLVGWVNCGKHFKISKENILVCKKDGIWRIILKLATQSNIYHIVVVVKDDDKCVEDLYLGASSDSRCPRAGEDWARGNDLHDGKFSFIDWNIILSDIVAYECVQHRSDAWKEKILK